MNKPTIQPTHGEFQTAAPLRPVNRGRAFWNGCLAAAMLATVTLFSTGLAAAANDDFADQPILEGNLHLIDTSSVGATAEPREPGLAGNPATASVWWTWIAPDTGPVVIDTLGSGFDTLLAVYVGDDIGALTRVAENDDAPGLPTSSVAFSAIQGTRYRIVVDGYQGATGEVRLQIRLPVVPTAPVIVSQPLSLTVHEDAVEPVVFQVGVTGTLPLGFHWQRNGQDLPTGTNAQLSLLPPHAAQAGDYQVVIRNPVGSITSSVVSLTVVGKTGHDRFADRFVIPGTSYKGGAYNLGATLEPGEPLHAGVPNTASLWWSWTAPKSGLVGVNTVGSTNTAGGVLDTVLAVYEGDQLDALTPVVANDDQSFGVQVTSRVCFRAAAGKTYLIATASRLHNGVPPASGFIALNLDLAPDNDQFANALPFPTDASQVLDHSVGATAEPGEPEHAHHHGGKSVWWTWVAPDDGTYQLDTVGSSFDTVLAIYTGSAVDALTLIAEDDSRSHGGASLTRFVATAGTPYRIVVDGNTGSDGIESGSIVLNLNPAGIMNDDFAERVTLSGRTNRVTVSNVGATKEVGEPNHGNNAGGRSLWWTWTARQNGPVTITTRESTFDTALAVYTGTNLTQLNLVGENEDSDPLDPSAGSTVAFEGVQGQTYQIAVDGYRSEGGSIASGMVVLRVTQPPLPQPGGNDDFEDRFLLVGQKVATLGSNLTATKEPGEPSHAGNDGGRSLWWSWKAPASGPVQVGTVGSDFDTVLAVYQGTSVDALTFVDADERSGDNDRSLLTFEAIEGAEYQIAVDGFNDGDEAAAGRLVLSLNQFPPGVLHANDDFAQASPISDAFPTVAGSNIGATRETGEPAHSELAAGHSVWWSWTARESGPVTVSTDGSQFDTVLAIYNGNSVANLSLVGENDDLDPEHLRSQVTFEALAGTRYFIAVDGYDGEIGFITLTVTPLHDAPLAPQIRQTPESQTRFANGGGGGTDVRFRVIATGALPLAYQWFRDGNPIVGATGETLTVKQPGPAEGGAYQVEVTNTHGSVRTAPAELTVFPDAFNDDFAARLPVSGSYQVVRGSVLGATKQAGEANHGAQVGGRSVWWRWTAPTNGPTEIKTVGSNFDTLLAVYTGTDLATLQRVAQNNDLRRDDSNSRVLFNAIAGVEYAIAVDGMKTNGTAGNVVLTILQATPGPRITVQPAAWTSVPVKSTGFALEVTVDGAPGSTRFQWFFNGQPIPSATNARYPLGSLSRARSGVYFVTVTNEAGSTVSDNATVWVEVPQVLACPEILPDGTVRLRFADPDGSVASNPDRFQVQHTTHLGGSDDAWTITPGVIRLDSGRWMFEDRTLAPGETMRTYRVVER